MKLRRLVQAGALTALIDGAFSSVLSRFFYDSTITRLFQGVASVVLGPEAMNGGLRTAAIGVAMHVGVAFAWSVIFLILLTRVQAIGRIARSRYGALKIAAVYGPVVWMAMSLAVIPALTGRPPSITVRWWVQFFGHIPFVALPIVATLRRR